ncbi:MAG: lipid-A-disaccharide synthase, partial [Candidatus Sericytochromatia bacterium]
MRPDILIVSNGPGELASWVRPVVRQFGRDFPEARLTVALVPCPYASGEEAATVTAWGERVRVWQPAETMRLVLSGRAPEALSESGAVLFLGGDQVFAALLSL